MVSYQLNREQGLIEHLDQGGSVIDTHKPSKSELWAFNKLQVTDGELGELFAEFENEDSNDSGSSGSIGEFIAFALFVMLLFFLFWGEPDVWDSLRIYFLNI